MIFRNKNKGQLTLQDLFSREILEHSLCNLPWTFAENPKKGKAWEFVKISDIDSISPVLALILTSMKKNQVFGEYSYYFYRNRIERSNPKKIKPKTKFFSKFKLSSPLKIRIKPKPKSEGVVVKVE